MCVVGGCRQHITSKYIRLYHIILFQTFKVITHNINLIKGLCVCVLKHCTKVSVCVFVCLVRLQIAEQKKPLPVPPSSGYIEYYYLRVCQRTYFKILKLIPLLEKITMCNKM